RRAEAAEGENHLHADAAGGAGGALRQDALPRRLHEGGGGPEDQPARVPGPGQAGGVKGHPAPPCLLTSSGLSSVRSGSRTGGPSVGSSRAAAPRPKP
ncbi:unnamed protein product, partial [Tetraodon nigroviridis]